MPSTETIDDRAQTLFVNL